EDEKGVVLPASYFTFVTSDGAVAQVSADGKVHGIGRGAAVIRASSHGITAADSVYVSTSLVEGALLNSAEQVFDVYPGAVTLIEGVGRRQVVIDANMHGNDSTAASGTVYIMQDTTVATVTPDGLITAAGVGVTRLTVIKNGLQKDIEIRVVAEP